MYVNSSPRTPLSPVRTTKVGERKKANWLKSPLNPILARLPGVKDEIRFPGCQATRERKDYYVRCPVGVTGHTEEGVDELALRYSISLSDPASADFSVWRFGVPVI